MLNVKPTLATGHSLPEKPVYWLIWVLDENTRVPYHSRVSYNKHLTPHGASMDAYGTPPSANMVFFNMTSTVRGLRRSMIQARKQWQEAGGK